MLRGYENFLKTFGVYFTNLQTGSLMKALLVLLFFFMSLVTFAWAEEPVISTEEILLESCVDLPDVLNFKISDLEFDGPNK